MVPFQTIPPAESFGWKDFFDSLAFPWGKVARAKPVTDEGNAEGTEWVGTEERSFNSSLV